MKCPACGAPIAQGLSYCSLCKTPITGVMPPRENPSSGVRQLGQGGQWAAPNQPPSDSMPQASIGQVIPRSPSQFAAPARQSGGTSLGRVRLFSGDSPPASTRTNRPGQSSSEAAFPWPESASSFHNIDGDETQEVQAEGRALFSPSFDQPSALPGAAAMPMNSLSGLGTPPPFANTNGQQPWPDSFSGATAQPDAPQQGSQNVWQDSLAGGPAPSPWQNSFAGVPEQPAWQNGQPGTPGSAYQGAWPSGEKQAGGQPSWQSEQPGIAEQAGQPAWQNSFVPEQAHSWERGNSGNLSASFVSSPGRKMRSSFAMVIIVCSVLLVLVGGGFLAVFMLNQRNSPSPTATPQTNTGQPTAPASSTGVVTPGASAQATVSTGPSGQKVVPAIASMFSNVQTSSAIDVNFQPMHVTSTFTAKQSTYITFHIDSKNQPGYVQMRWYGDSKLVLKDQLTHDPQSNVAYFGLTYQEPSNGAAELYWCARSDCSDAQLAQVVKFKVGPAAS